MDLWQGLDNELIMSNFVLTVCDSDTTFHPKFFENLTHAFLAEPLDSRFRVCWQSPLFYNIKLDERYFFTRAIGVLRSYFMVSGARPLRPLHVHLHPPCAIS